MSTTASPAPTPPHAGVPSAASRPTSEAGAGLVKIGFNCLSVPMFSDTARVRAGHGRPGEPLRHLARQLRDGNVSPTAILLGAGHGERLADLATSGLGPVLCLEAAAETYAMLEINAPGLGGIPLRMSVGEQNAEAPRLSASVPSVAFPELLTRFAQFRDARLLVCAAGQDGPSALQSSAGWLATARPVLVLEVVLKSFADSQRWARALDALTALGYRAVVAFDQFDHPLGWVSCESLGDLLQGLESARRYGGGLTSATLFMATAADESLVSGVRAALQPDDAAPGAHRVAIVRMDHLGDQVLGAGAFRAVRGRFPYSKLVAVVPAELGDLYARCPFIDGLITLPTPATYLRNAGLREAMLRHLAGYPKFDLVIHPRFAEDYFAAGGLCGAIVAPGGRAIGFRQAHNPIPQYDHNSYFTELLESSATLHAAEYAGVMATAVNGAPTPAPPEVWFDLSDWQRVAERFGLEPYRYVAVGIGASWPNKTPAPEIYRRVLDRLLKESLRVVLIGSAQEHAFAATLRGMSPDPERIVNTAGVLRFYEIAALLKHTRLYIGPDSGPKHIAAAVRTPVIEIAWVPADHPATSRGHGTAGRCWNAWGTVTRVIHPVRASFDQAVRDSGYTTRPIAGLDPVLIDRAIGELLQVK